MGVVGWKNSGKTTLITRLIPALGARGISVSTIKHVHHAIDLDEPGKDTFRHREAGAVDVVMYSEARWALLHERRSELDPAAELAELVRRMSPVDLILVEGFKKVAMRRIEIRWGDAAPLTGDRGAETLAVVTDGSPDPDLPSFRRDEIEGLADFIADTLNIDLLKW
ncbi:MAG: molybdopterin-guanine dinucleotide biosynthesis protein B [Bauldia sp.]|nr:molybdopterin-guanine dinucleotide biosynthesis protein B [Bauldia sp.]